MAAPIEAQARQGRETKLSRTFGEELCAARWLVFKSHYELVIRANVANNVENWLNQQYRAVQLRLQISGEPECWLNQAEQSGEAWVQSGDAIVERFDRRFVTADGIEMAIRHFEEARQEVAEELGSFMSRLRRLAGYAFSMEGEDSRRSRVIWKFIAGILREAVRRDIIRQNRRDSGDRDEWTIRFGHQTSTLHTICVVLCRRIARKARLSARAITPRCRHGKTSARSRRPGP